MIFVFLSFVSIFTVGHDCGSLRGDIQLENNAGKRHAVYSPKLSRDDFLLNEPGNASLYIDFGQHSSHKPPSRISRALDLDVFLGDKTRQRSVGVRQSRILNEDIENKPNLAIQGFIPIVSVGQQASSNSHKSYEQHNVNVPPESGESYAGPGDAKFIGAALQNLASSLGAKPKRKFSHNFSPIGNAECVCVPFYMCKNGFLVSSAKNGHNGAFETQNFEESLAAAQTELNKHSIPAQLTSFYEQQTFLENNGQPLPLVDERSIDGSSNSNNNQTTPEYVSDVFSKIVARSNSFSMHCGVLRTCCRMLSEYVAPNEDHFQVPPSVQNNYPMMQPEANLPFLRPQLPKPNYAQFIRPPNQILTNHQTPHLRPLPFRAVNPIRPTFNTPNVKRQTIPHRYSYQHFKPEPSLAASNHHPAAGQNFCGVRNSVGIHGRVQNLQYHESSAEFGEYPWQVAILKRLGPSDSLYVCGGVLISDQWVATAAHCIKKNGAIDLKVRLGEWDVHRDDEFYPFVEKFIDEILIHPEFYSGNLVNDIALLRLDSKIDLSYPTIASACLPERYESFVGHRCWVTGWGKDAFGHKGSFQSVLKEVDVPIVNQAQCENILRKTRLGMYYELHPGFLCAGGEPGKDACEGDGGSPLVCEVGGLWKVVGLVSWGIGCGQPGVPGVYVNLSHYRDWIESVFNKYAALNGGYDSSAIIERSNANAANITDSFKRYSVDNFTTANVNDTKTESSTSSSN